MSRAFLVTLAVVLLAASPSWAVSGGAAVPPASYPFVGVVGGICTGTLIAPDRVLTAAHCLAGMQNHDASVRLGATSADALDGPAVPTYHAKGLVLHPQFEESFPFAHKSPVNAIALNDVGLVILDRPVTDVAPVPLATTATKDQLGLGVTLLGYGLTKPPPQIHLKPGDILQPTPVAPLQAGGLSLISPADCLKAYPHAIIASEICSEDLTADATPVVACSGDSGGPLLAPGPVQIAITSWGPEVKNNDCGQARLPDVGMRVSSFTSFITDPHPVLAPRSLKLPRVTGTRTLTCHAPRYSGSAAKLTYQWGIAARGYANSLTSTLNSNPGANLTTPLTTPLHGATAKTFVTGGARSRGKRVACAVTAGNASGSWTVYSRRAAAG